MGSEDKQGICRGRNSDQLRVTLIPKLARSHENVVVFASPHLLATLLPASASKLTRTRSLQFIGYGPLGRSQLVPIPPMKTKKKVFQHIVIHIGILHYTDYPARVQRGDGGK